MKDSTIEQLVRDYFVTRKANEELQARLQVYRTPVDLADEKFMKGVLCYLREKFLPMSHEEGLRVLYGNFRIFAHDYPAPIREYKYSPVWTRYGTSGLDVCRMTWGINKAIGYKTPEVGIFLKTVFPNLFRNTSVRTLASNLIRYEDGMIIREINFGDKLPREWFEDLYDSEQAKRQ